MQDLKINDKLVIFLLILVLFVGNLTDRWVQTHFRLLDVVVLILFIKSIFLTGYRVKKVDLLVCLFAILNTGLLVLNTKHLFSYSSIFYLFRFLIYIQTYPYFIKVFNRSKNLDFFRTLIPFFLLFHLVVLSLKARLDVSGYDPHVGRLYGPFLDPNFYAVLLVIMLAGYFSLKKWHKLELVTVIILLVSIFLTFSRVGVLLTGLLLFSKYVYSKNSTYISLSLGFVLLLLTNIKYLFRIFFIDGNLQSFVFRIKSYLDGVSIYSNTLLPLGFNNILPSKTFLTSSLNMSSSYTDSFVLNLLLTGGLINLLFFILVIYVLGKNFIYCKFSLGTFALFFITFSSLSLNVFFQPYFFLILVIMASYSTIYVRPKNKAINSFFAV